MIFNKYEDPTERQKLWESLTPDERAAVMLIIRKQNEQHERDFYSIKRDARKENKEQ